MIFKNSCSKNAKQLNMNFQTKMYLKVTSFTNVAAYGLYLVMALVKGYRSLQMHG